MEENYLYEELKIRTCNIRRSLRIIKSMHILDENTYL